jgi:hypothetical protein
MLRIRPAEHRPRDSKNLLVSYAYSKKSGVWGKIEIGVFCLFFGAKPTVLGVLVGFAGQ